MVETKIEKATEATGESLGRRTDRENQEWPYHTSRQALVLSSQAWLKSIYMCRNGDGL